MVAKRSPDVNSFSPGDKLMGMVNEVKLLLRDFSRSRAASFYLLAPSRGGGEQQCDRGTG